MVTMRQSSVKENKTEWQNGAYVEFVPVTSRDLQKIIQNQQIYTLCIDYSIVDYSRLLYYIVICTVPICPKSYARRSHLLLTECAKTFSQLGF